MTATEEAVRRTARVLVSFMSPQEAQGFASGIPLDPGAFMLEWAGKAAAAQGLTRGYAAGRVENIPATMQAHVQALLAHQHFATIYPNAEFKYVELGRLIAFQHWMDTDVSDGVHGEGIQGVPDEAKILERCLPPGIVPPAQMRWQQSPNGLTVYSMNNTVGLLGPKLNPADGTITYAVATGPNLMLVREHAGRYILANGYHRAWWLRSRGVEMVPVVVTHHASPAEVAQPNMIPPDVLFNSPRPPLVDDFLDDALSISVEVRSMLRMVKITTEVSFVPRLL